jgi:integrase
MRNSEIERIQVKDLITIGDTYFINIPKSKTKNGVRIVPLHNFAYKKLKRYIHKRGRGADDYIFTKKGTPRGSKLYRAANMEMAEHAGYTAEQLEAEHITFYSGRHFWKTLMNSDDLGDVEEYFMGHTISNDVAKRYNHRDKQGQSNLLKNAAKVFAILDKRIF